MPLNEPKITGVTKVTRQVYNKDGELLQTEHDVRSYEKPFKAIPKSADGMREFFLNTYKADRSLVNKGMTVGYSFGHSRGRAGVLVR